MMFRLFKELKRIVKKTRWGKRIYWKRRIARYEQMLADQSDMTSVFRNHLQSNEWGSSESLSGPGSEVRYTEAIRQWLPATLVELNAKEFLDAPCGDFNWMQHVRLPESISYTGADLLTELIAQNDSKYANQQRTFMQLDICSDELPSADVWLCRDCLFHLDFISIRKVFTQLLSSDIKHWMLTSHIEPVPNFDCSTGGFRPLNFMTAPFNFPPPELSVNDWVGNAHRRIVGVWKIEDIHDRLVWLRDEWQPSN